VEVLSADWVLPVSSPPVSDGAVAIEDGRIVAVGSSADLGEGRRFPDAAILPGLVNAHSHLEYAVYAGFGDALSFAPWISLHVERKGRISFDDMTAIARLGAAECLASGITTVGDASFSGAAAPACAELGLRAIVYLEVFGADPSALARFEVNRDRIAHTLSDTVRLGVSPHAPYTCSPELYAAAAELGIPIATHLSESDDELDWVRSGTGAWEAFADLLIAPYGTTGIRLLAERGLLGPQVTAAHCVVVDDEEIALLAGSDVAVAHCPRSNAVLGCGVAPLTDLLAAGIRVGLGTDSPASTPSFDMWEELRSALYFARSRAGRPDALSAAAALELATLGSARALGLAREIGSLEPGKLADVTVLSLEGSPFLPWEDPAAAAVFGGSPARVLLTLVGGEVRYERGTFVWHELRQNGIRARRRLLGR
jgi:5-methylthioadenosine/S-adenosylhomocysteine deaminase